jgi:hypothetical protein
MVFVVDVPGCLVRPELVGRKTIFREFQGIILGSQISHQKMRMP